MKKHWNKMFSVVTILALMLMALPMQSASAAGTISLTTLGSTYSENFDTLSNVAASTTNTLAINGWELTETGGGARDNEQYAVDTGGSNTGDTYSYGSAAVAERALGGLQSGTLIPTIGAAFVNNTGATITSLDVAYTGEQWRIGNTAAARDDRLDFQYSTDATSLTTGTWNNVDSLDFTNPVKTAAAQGALDGNNAANRAAISATISDLSIADGATFWVRWTDLNASGADDGLAVDDFSLTPNGGEVPVAEPKINEFVFNHVGTDTNEYVEVVGDANTDYSAYSILQIEGDTTGSGTVDSIFPVGTTNSSGHWYTGFLNGPLENGTVTLLLVKDFTSSAGTDLDTNNDGAFDSTPWSALVDDVAVSDAGAGDVAYSTTILAPGFGGNPFTSGGASRIPDGADTDSVDDWVLNDFDLAGIPGFTGTPVEGEAYNTPGAPNEAVPAAVPQLVINEVDYDQPSTDTAEFVEIRNNGSTAVSLSGWTLELVNGDAGGAVIYDTIVLPAVSLAAGDYFVVCANAATVSNCDLDDGPDSNFIQNGSPDAVGLRFNGNLIDAVSYEGNTGAPYTEGSGTGLVDTAAGSESISRCPDGADTNVNNVDFAVAGSTPGAANDCVPPPPQLTCDGTYTFTSIHDIQGTGASTTMSGQEVIIEGVVVGDFQASDGDATDLAGFYVQEEDIQADANPLTSEGIFIFDLGSSVNVQAGDVVRVLGNVNEFQNQTQINAGAIVVCGSGQGALVSPTVIPFPLPNGQADLEQYEGMLVTTNQPMTVIEYFNLDRFGTVDVATERLETPTDAAEPGPASDAVLAYNNARRIRLDDGSQTQNPFPVTLPDGQLEYGDAFGGGDTLSNIVGVLSWIRPGIGLQPEGYAIQLTQLPTFENTNPRPADPPEVGGSFKVVGFNVLNYFNGNGMGGGFPTSRGATDPAEFQKQTTKIVAALVALDADVVGLIEIENDFADGANSAIADLVDALNAATAPGTYAYIDPGVNVGTDEITVAIIYKPATATPVGDLAILDSQAFVNPFNADIDRNRPALAQTFMSVETGGVMTVVVNHLKSKGSGCGSGDDDPRQGSCNLTRTASAQVLVDWLTTDPTGSGDTDFLLIGDYNAYAKEDPIDVFTNAGYVDLFALFQPEDVYSYVFDGMTGYLDYGIASPTLVSQVTGAAPWNINSDEPDAFEYDELFDNPANLPLWYAPTPYRSSDHDPVVVGLDLLQYGFNGFFQPIDNFPIVNTVKAGQAVPIKFSLSGDLGLDVFFDGYPTFEFGSCDPSSGDPVEETVPNSNSGLTYDPVTNQYTFVWKTDRNWSNKCGTLTIVFDDGTIRNILFRFTR
jgi:predicted extracellular nuclease